jgi:hypothetical protein
MIRGHNMFSSLWRMRVLACVVAVAIAGGMRDERPRGGHYGTDFQWHSQY